MTFLILASYLLSCFAFTVAFFAHNRARRAEKQAEAIARLNARFMRAVNRTHQSTAAILDSLAAQEQQTTTDASWRDMDTVDA